MRRWLVAMILVALPGVAAGQSVISPASIVGTGVASGDVLIRLGVCPTGYTEVTGASGRYLIAVPSGGTVASTTGSAMADLADASYTPAGTNSTSTVTPLGTNSTSTVTPLGTNSTSTVTPLGTSTFTGSALGTHQHSGTTSRNSSGAYYLTNNWGTGAASLNANELTANQTADTTSRVWNLTEGVSAGTPAGTVAFTGSPSTVAAQTFTGSSSTVTAQTFTGSSSTVAAQTFTGTAATTMRSTIAPGYQLRLCQKS